MGGWHRVVGAEKDLAMNILLLGKMAQCPGPQGRKYGGDIGVEILMLPQSVQEQEVVSVKVTWILG